MTTSGTAQDLLFEVSGGIARITVNRPEARNAFTFEMYEKLAQSCEAVGKDDTVKVLVITGAGEKAFSAGTDISAFRNFKTPEDAIGYEAVHGAGSWRAGAMPRSYDCGHCRRLHWRGRGDRRLLRSAHRHGGHEIRLSHSAHARQLLVRSQSCAGLSALIGAQRVKDLIFTARLIEAEEALRVGLLTEVVEGRAELDKRAGALAEAIAGLCTADAARDERGAAPAAGERSAGSGPDLDVLYERGFPGRHERLSGKEKSQLAGEVRA